MLSEREVLPHGADKPVKVNVRVICASHRDLLEMVRAGLFREDLYYRLSGVVVHLPAVRERSDLPELLKDVLVEEINATGIQAALSPAVKKVLEVTLGQATCGKCTTCYALSLSENGLILPNHLPEELGGTIMHPHPDATTRRAGLEALLKQHGWYIEAAAEATGVARSTLYRQMDRLHIVPPHRIAPGSSRVSSAGHAR